MKVVMTRTSDHFVSLSQRVMIAQKAKAHLFISIHADAWTKPSAKGASVYALAERARQARRHDGSLKTKTRPT